MINYIHMIVDGRKIAEEVLEELEKEISSKNLKLRLAAVLVCPEGIEGLGLKKFVELKGKAAEKIGIDFEMYQFSENINTDKLKQELVKISKKADGVLIELPLPSHINSQEVLNQIPIEKDVDVLSDKAQARFFEVQPRRLIEVKPQILPPAVEALKIVLEKYKINPKDKKVAVFGRGILIGKPISHWLEKQGAEVYKINSKTENPEEFSKKADIVVAGVGKPGIITGSMVKEGVVIVDFGYGKKDGQMVGDVDFDSVAVKASLITPVPGGMGPILITAVIKNLVKLKMKI
ncbi:MAG: bifunctional 5,10-methylenetetrahydrofolate dehydrogenase/5,10-methenyltetrahydrofolate cyclohydrolase [bacterium]|nr:bifunctional 5,10-methylenetetrahydrofolate dehydrogenase/5,10-methenyltetrahydrofolate cyclohydrolase [bacterium]